MYLRDGCWYSDFWHDKRRHSKSWGKISKTVASEKDRKFRTEILEGKQNLKAKRILFEKFIEKYLEYARLNKRPKSVKRNEVSIKMLMPHFKGNLLQAINLFMIEQYKKKRKEEGRAPATINRDIVTIHNMMRKAVEWKYLAYNPLAGMKQLKEENERMWVLTPEEEKKLLEACQKSPQRKGAKYLRDLVLFALHSGMREQEIFSIRKSHVNLERRFLSVTHTKTGRDRTVPINETLKEILDRRMQNDRSEYLFYNSKGQKLTVLTNAFWYAVKMAGLIRTEIDRGESKDIRFRFHDCRQTFGSRLGMAGKDLKTIMDIMGHSTVKVAMRYQHPMPEHKLDAVKILDQVPSVFTTSKEQERKIVNLHR